MKVKVKNLTVGAGGFEFGVYDGKGHVGDLFVTKAGLTWCKGKTGKKNGTPIAWKEFIAKMNGPTG